MKDINKLREEKKKNDDIVLNHMENLKKQIEIITNDYFKESLNYIEELQKNKEEIEKLKKENSKYKEQIELLKEPVDFFEKFDLSDKEKSLLNEIKEFLIKDFKDLLAWGLKKDVLEQEDIDLIKVIINGSELEKLKELELIELLEMYEFLKGRGFKRGQTEKILLKIPSKSIKVEVAEEELREIINTKNELIEIVEELEEENKEIKEKVSQIKVKNMLLNREKKEKEKENKELNSRIKELENKESIEKIIELEEDKNNIEKDIKR